MDGTWFARIPISPVSAAKFTWMLRNVRIVMRKRGQSVDSLVGRNEHIGVFVDCLELWWLAYLSHGSLNSEYQLTRKRMPCSIALEGWWKRRTWWGRDSVTRSLSDATSAYPRRRSEGLARRVEGRTLGTTALTAMRKALMAVVGIRWQVQRGWKASLRCGGDGNGWN